MKSILICPAVREHFDVLTESAPLVNLPVYGRSLIEHWLAHLATLGAKEVLVLATDRPEQTRKCIGNGSRWGIRAEVVPEIRELTPTEARAKYCIEGEEWLAAPNDAVLVDHLPDMPDRPLFTDCANLFRLLQDWIVCTAAAPDRIGVHEIKPGVWTGLHARISPDAELLAPCWIGDNVFVGAQTTIGPEAVLEDSSFVERGAEISHSIVGTETFVGEFTEIHNSIAQGSTLVNWKLGSTVKVRDSFLLCSLARTESSVKFINFLGRLVAMLLLLLTLPVALLLMLKPRFRGVPALRPRIAVRPHAPGAVVMPGDTLVYHELAGAPGWFRRWPQLWSVVRGDFSWIGNRPISPNQATHLAHDFERLWLNAPIGLISLADAEACSHFSSAEARAHASYYAAHMNWRLNLEILGNALFLFVVGEPRSHVRERFVRIAGPAHVEMGRAN